MELGEKIRLLRQRRGLTLEAVGRIVGVGKSTVGKWESGQIANMGRDKIAALAEALGVTPGYLMGWEAPAAHPELLPVRRARVPLLGEAAAGEPGCAAEAEAEDGWDCALRVADDAMEPTLRAGDLVYLRAQADVADGEIAALRLDGGARLRRVYHQRDGLTLTADNAAKYPPRRVEAAQAGECILGRAVAYRRALGGG